MIKKDELKDLIFDLFEMNLSSDQLKVFISKLMTCLCKKIINVEIIINNQNKPTKKEFEMTYFQLLLDLMERDEFLFAWINSENFFQNLEILFEMHAPS